MLTLNGHWQAVIYLICEVYVKFFYPLKFEREVFTLSDNGTIALDWALDCEGGFPVKNSKRPILCCISGLSGGNDSMYLASMIRAASRGGYKCVVVNFRGTSGMKLTSPMIYWQTTWRDIQEPIEYINDKYCGKVDAQYTKRNIYAYAVSLGSGMLAKYLVESGENCPLSGALNYGTFFNVKDNVPYFTASAWKFYDKVMGLNFYYILKDYCNQIRGTMDDDKLN